MTVLEGSVLLIEDDAFDAEVVLRGLRRIANSSLEVRWVTSLSQAREAVADLTPQIVLTDLTLPDARDLDVVSELVEMCGDSSIIVQTDVEDEQLGIRSLELGAQDFLCKGSITSEVLGRAIRYALARSLTRTELLRARREQEQSANELNGFAHVVAHDLRAPVRTARLFADRLMHVVASEDEVVLDYGARLESSLEKVDRMILSMLDYASLRSVVADASSVDMAENTRQCAQLIGADLDAAQGVIHVDAEDGVMAMADEEQITRVLLNLLANSVKYRRDDVELEIEVLARKTDATVTIDVVDNGTGVSPDDAERAFEILERLDPHRSDGLGFGLAISRRIVEGYGGSIRFVPDQAVGAHVEIVLPSGS